MKSEEIHLDTATNSSETSEQTSNSETFASDSNNEKCCNSSDENITNKSSDVNAPVPSKSCKISMDDSNRGNSYAGNKNTAEGLMDIALLSANANQLRFLITYNHEARTYFISISLVAISLLMQIIVGIALIFKRRFRRCRSKRYNEFIVGGVFLITVVNILLAAFTTTTETK